MPNVSAMQYLFVTSAGIVHAGGLPEGRFGPRGTPASGVSETGCPYREDHAASYCSVHVAPLSVERQTSLELQVRSSIESAGERSRRPGHRRYPLTRRPSTAALLSGPPRPLPAILDREPLDAVAEVVNGGDQGGVWKKGDG
jgi:hypothetical protein